MGAFLNLARLAYSVERAAAYAYRGHAASVRDAFEKADLLRIEKEEWLHREQLSRILEKLGERPSPWLEGRGRSYNALRYEPFITSKEKVRA